MRNSPLASAIESLLRGMEAKINELRGENARFRKALEEIEQLALGPDRGGASWQADSAHEIARDALYDRR